jgi:hypothetical protein
MLNELPRLKSCCILVWVFMSGTGPTIYAPRPAMQPLVWALVVSLVTHLLLYGGYELGRKLHWWDKQLVPAWLKKATETLIAMQPPQKKPPVTQPETPLLFVEVNPETATQEAPEHATHYSSQNSKAANPNAQIETQTPKLDGTQTHVPKTENVPRRQNFPLMPSVPKPAKPEEASQPSKPKGGQAPGDLAMAKPDTQPGETGEANAQAHERPRTLAAARAQQAMRGDMMKQEGGVKRQRVVPSFDAIGSPFGVYDAEIIRAIQQHWDDLLEEQHFARERTGKVVLRFRLNYDGTITDMTPLEVTVDDLLEYLCERAIRDPAPYARWPSDMRRLIGADYRVVTFTFYYD